MIKSEYEAIILLCSYSAVQSGELSSIQRDRVSVHVSALASLNIAGYCQPKQGLVLIGKRGRYWALRQGYLVALHSRICNKSALAIACPPHVEELMQKADLGFRGSYFSESLGSICIIKTHLGLVSSPTQALRQLESCIYILYVNQSSAAIRTQWDYQKQQHIPYLL